MSIATMNFSGANGPRRDRMFGERVPAMATFQLIDVMGMARYAMGGLVLLAITVHVGLPELPRSIDFTSANPPHIAMTSAKAKASLLAAAPVSISITSAVLKDGPVAGVERMVITAEDARPVRAPVRLHSPGPVEFATAPEQVVAFADPRSLTRDPNV